MARDRIDTMHEFIVSTGGRPRVQLPSLQWCLGTRRNPFRVGCTLKNAAVTNSDLTTQDAWYEDPNVRTAYAPADGSTTKLRAILNIEAVRVLVMSSVFSALDATVKDDVSAQLFLTLDVGGSVKRFDLRGCVREPQKEFQKTQASATLADWWLLAGDWCELGPGAHNVDLEINNLKLESLNSVAYGADITQCWVEIIGHLVPKGTDGAGAYLPGAGGSCSTQPGQTNFALTSPRAIAQWADLPQLRAQSIQ